MHLAWSEADEQFREELRKFIAEHAPPEAFHGYDFQDDVATGPDRIPEWLREWQATLFDHGWMIPGYPPELGGRNATPVQTLIYLEELALQRIPRATHFPGYAIVAPSLLEFGNDEQKQLAPAAIRGDTIWCIGMSEPNAGSDLAGLTTRAELDGDRFVVNGQKVWTSYAMVAAKCFCYVRTDPTAPKHKGISLLIIDMDTPGIDIRPLRHINGQADFAEVFFTDVIVPKQNLVGALHGGWAITQGSLAHERGGLVGRRRRAPRADGAGTRGAGQARWRVRRRGDAAQDRRTRRAGDEPARARLQGVRELRPGFVSTRALVHEDGELRGRQDRVRAGHGDPRFIGRAHRPALRGRGRALREELLHIVRQHHRRRHERDPAQHHCPARAGPTEGITVDFSLTGHQELIRETAERMLERECPPALLRARHGRPRRGRAVCGPTCATSWSSARATAPICACSSTRSDTCSAPGPFFATAALAVPLVVALGGAAPAGLLDRLTSGDATATVAISGRDGTWQPNPSPTKWFVPDADIVDVILVVEPEWRVRVIDAADAIVDVVETADSTRRLCTVEVASTTTAEGSGAAPAQLDADAAALWLDRVYVSAAAELVGTARRLFDLALAYAKERVQFDRPIGSFQAIQHKLADMSLALERSTAAVHYGAMTVDGEIDAGSRARAAHTAKAAAGTAAQRILKDSIQIHGGIGYTWEHDLHLFLRRATVGATQFGTTKWHHNRIADLLFA